MWEITITIFLKDGVLDVQGRAVEQVLHSRGYKGIQQLKVGKCITFLLESSTKEEAEITVNKLANNILVNPLIETFKYTIQPYSFVCEGSK